MNSYLTIHEFARLRNVNANSLRYYEKLGLLIPARTDPRTRYRYYLPEQLGTLDIILLCIKLGIPLKNLTQYIDCDGILDEKRLLEDGKDIMQKKIEEMQAEFALTQFNLHSMEQNRQYSGQKGIYTRRIEKRFFIYRSFAGSWNSLPQKEEAALELFQDAQAQHMIPVFPAGVLIHFETVPVSYSFFVQVLHPPKQNRQILCIPRADFACLQADITPQTDLLELIRESFPDQAPKTVILSNMAQSRLHFDSRHSELQVLLSP